MARLLCALLLALALAPACRREPGAEAGGSPQASAGPDRELDWERARPAEETRFLAAIADFGRVYASQQGEGVRARVRAERDEELARILPGGALQSWAGVLEARGTAPDGAGFVRVRLAADVRISDAGDRARIGAGSLLFARLGKLEVGAPVVFTGTILAPTTQPEADAMRAPGFLVRFDDLRALGEPPRPAPAQADAQAAPGPDPDPEPASAPQLADTQRPLSCSERQDYWRRQGKPEWLIRESLRSLGCS